jgi:16S rRNA (uracil1498-N3)-methyltransferase
VSLRVFAPLPESGAPAVLDAEESHYLRRVRRVGDGAAVELIDDRGGLWRATVRGGDVRRTELTLHERVVVPAPARELVLLLGLPEPAAVLELLPGVVELGVAAVAWVRCERSQSGPPGPARVERVLRAAQRQCGRPNPPQLLGSFDLAAAVAVRGDLPGFFGHVEASVDDPAPGAASGSGAVSGARLLVGPEGGFSAPEVAAAIAAGFVPLGLGPHVLRTGTAALVGLARLMFT